MFRFTCVACIVVSFFSVSSLWSQTATGRIVGTVSDPTGAVIPGASISVTNVNTQVTYETMTNEQGFYQALLLPIGAYTVTANMAGFQKALTNPEKLEINQSLRVDIRMVVGARSEAVVVEESVTRVETLSTMLGGIITGNQIAAMPLTTCSSMDKRRSLRLPTSRSVH